MSKILYSTAPFGVLTKTLSNFLWPKRALPTGDSCEILFSPGAASFGMFKNEFDRGDKFNKIVKSF